MFSDKLYLFLATLVSLAIVVILTVRGVEWWIGALIFPPVIVAGLLVKQRAENKRLYERQPQPAYQPPPPPQPAPPANMPVHGLVLPSAQRDYRFLLDFTVLWRPTGAQGGVTHPRPEQLAVDAVRERAATFTERESPAVVDMLGTRLATELSFPRPDRTGQLEVWAQAISLGIPDDDRERLRKLAEIRKDEEVWEHERAYERNKRTYLREDVLSSTGSAVVWWLARDVTRVPETVDLIDTLAKLVAAAQDRELAPAVHMFVNSLNDPAFPPPTSDSVPDKHDFVDRLMAELLPEGSEAERTDLADRLAIMAAEAGATDLASTLRERFDAPDFTEVPSGPSLFDTSGTDPFPEPASPVHPNGQPEAGTPETPPSAPYTP